MGIIVIACYRPKPGKSSELQELLKSHLQVLREQGLATDRESIMMTAKDGTFLEVFEWKSQEAIDAAHSNEAVQKMWEAFFATCDFVPLNELPEATEMFAGFTPFTP